MMVSDISFTFISFIVYSARISITLFRWSNVTLVYQYHDGTDQPTVELQSSAGAFIAKYALIAFVSWLT